MTRTTQELDRRKEGNRERNRDGQYTRRHRQPSRNAAGLLQVMFVSISIILLAFSSLPTAHAAFITFDDCLSPSILTKVPQQLQFIPQWVDARFDLTDSKRTLNLTVYGNVTGQTEDVAYPSAEHWNASDPIFNIVDSTVNYTTLFAHADVLSYTAWDPQPSRFCNHTINGTCPWQPLFGRNPYNPYELHAFTVANDFYSSYSFASFATTLRVQSGDENAPMLACISAGIAPDLGSSLANSVCYIPAAILALVGIATILAARYSPWSSQNIFYWTSNYGRDDDILRLVTPGFGDCLQYIQFVVLAGSLSLGYPGFYQPVVSQASWSVLMFNESFVSHGNGTQSLRDGIYVTNGTYGITRLSQLAGMTHDEDVWAGMAVWLCVIIVAVVVLCQLGFALRTLVRLITEIPEEDLRSKNLPFTFGNIVRILLNYFLLPIISLSMFQLVVASRSPTYVIALAVILLIAVVALAAWIFRLIFTTRPRVHLFDHLPLLLAYGPLYNTYSDEAAPYAFIPFLLTCIRGIAMGAVQPSGIAQLVVLAICEVVLILTLHAFRPFQSLTSMNAYHTFFAVVRLVTSLLMVAFVPSLGVDEAVKGWIGYAVLLLHAMVLIFGFFLNSIQTLIEVFARLAGAGREARGGLTTVFGVRQLSKRNKRPGPRSSMASHATALVETKSMNLPSRTMSASSTMMLNATSPDHRASTNFDSFSQGEAGSTISGTSPGPGTPGGPHSPFSFLPGANSAQARKGSRIFEPTAPYYRPPRQRRLTDSNLPDDTAIGEEGMARRPSQPLMAHAVYSDLTEAPSVLGSERGSVGAAYFRAVHNDSGDLGEPRKNSNTDYSTRESDFYYGVRGPALSSVPTRRLKTGPADPMSPVASATGWFKDMWGGKKKDKKKGFEVVRSTPLHLLREQDEPVLEEPYKDSPEQETIEPVVAESSSRVVEGTAAGERRVSEDSHYPDTESEMMPPMQKAPDAPPTLGPISTGGSIHMPSRNVSQTTTNSRRPPMPSLPRRSSRRNSKGENILLPAVNLSRMASFRGPGNTDPEARVPFASIDTEAKERSGRTSMASSIYPASELEPEEPLKPTSRAGRIGSMQNEEFVYSHPYDGHFSSQPGPSFRQSQGEDFRPVSTGRVVKHFAMEGVYTGDIHQGSKAELVEEEERKSSMKK